MKTPPEKPKAYSYLRFSRPEQIKGDSLRRQTEASRRYAEENGLELDETLTFRDMGISAFRGQNALEGQLGLFLEAVHEGTIPKRSYLLVESLDRLSRQNAYQAFNQFSALLNEGINIVTVSDGKTFSLSNGQIAFNDLMYSLMVMQRANEESETKSRRLKAAWKNKRDRAKFNQGKLTSICPAWLRLNKDTGTYEVLKEKAEVVRRIFQMALDGKGKTAIVRQFNSEGVPTFGRSKGWLTSYVQKILENEAVYGVYKPHKIQIVNGKRKRVPVDEPIEGYFPAVVDIETFLRAKQQRTLRRLPAGNTGKNFSNLFTGMVYCGNCGAPMHFENKGRGPKGGTYLVCSSARIKSNGCKRHAWRYPETQAHIISNINEVDYRGLFPNILKESQEVLNRLEGEVLKKEEQLRKVDASIEKILDLLEDKEDSRALLERLEKREKEKEQLKSELETLKKRFENEHGNLYGVRQKIDRIGNSMRRFIAIERNGTEEEIYEARQRLYQLLMGVIERIVLYPGWYDKVPSPPKKDSHGTIEVFFKRLVGYRRFIEVEKGQKSSVGYKVDGDGQVAAVHVIDAKWPPDGRILTGEGMLEILLNRNY
jgi:DNA invertase Pin-like site-specific DNA recombinase